MTTETSLMIGNIFAGFGGIFIGIMLVRLCKYIYSNEKLVYLQHIGMYLFFCIMFFLIGIIATIGFPILALVAVLRDIKKMKWYKEEKKKTADMQKETEKQNE